MKVVAVFPSDSHKPIVYPAALIKGRATPAATSFLQFLQTDKARNILRDAGFTAGG